MAKVNYTVKTLEVLRDLYSHAEVVERYNQFTRRRHDLLGIIDILSPHPKGPLGVQSTSANGRSGHHKTIMEAPGTYIWLNDFRGVLWLVTWTKKLKKKGGTAFTYLFNVDEYYLHLGQVKCNRNIEVEHKKRA